ncbi:hypothetical protein [Spiroplasma culicicola]|uniref:Uncharacterized protein n=1 Tax=Spiroplasma culicicola AES-1 TaxID=1276246 RepID=W6A6A1_9MOLU|nr:hypothetical protein [Spiroplasma culicicola]AHI52481.1 hypothetical protein SCULI_v1c01400 [Spiroplasma culicicola AES-1]
MMNNEKFKNDISDEEFIESFTAKQKYRKKENINDLLYLSKQVVQVFIYPLTTLNGKKLIEGLRIGENKINLMATTIDKVISIKAYLSDIQDYDLVESLDPLNPLEQLMRVTDTINFFTDEIKELDYECLYLLTKEKITENNLNDLKQYIGKIITPSIDETGMEMSFSSIEEFSNSFKTSPIRVVLSEPIKSKIKEIHITSPKGTLIGNIKPVDENGRFPELLAKAGTEIFPKLCFPFQTSPVLSIVDYWSSDQIIPLNDIFEFLDSKNIKYNEEFSLADFLVLGEEGNYPAIKYDHVEKISFKLHMKAYKTRGSSGNGPSGIVDDIFNMEFSNANKFGEGNLTKIFTKPNAKDNYFDADIANEFDTEFAIQSGVFKGKIQYKYSISDLNVIPTGISKSTTAFETLLKMLTETFWKDYEFEGATQEKQKDGQIIEEIKDWDIFKLSQKYAGQDRYSVTTNLWLSWKKINIDAVNANLSMVKRIENTITMLSGYIKSNFSINKGDNDDYKILLPFYFEQQNKIDNPIGHVKYEDIKVKLKSNYFEFGEDNIKIKDNCISRNLVHKLEYNHYAFPEMTNMIETASIPSSMPLDQQSANGEYSKYQVKCFSNQLVDIEKLKNHYGNGNINFNPLFSNKIVNNGEFEFDAPITIEEIKLSSFYGYGLWRINLIDENNNRYKLDLKLFEKNDSTISFINLIL